MKTFLEVEGKMGPMPASPFRPPLPDTNPNIRKDNVMEKRKRAAPKKLKPSIAPKPITMCLTTIVSKVPTRNDVPENRPPPLENVPICENTPWPGAGKTSGNLFDDRNWLLPLNYLATENKSDNVTSVTGPRPPIKEEETKINEQSACSSY